MDQTFRVRLNCIDYYRASPTKYDPVLRRHGHGSQLSKEPEVPVIRVFGSTETGQKVCAHIHGAFPYMFVEYTDSLAPEVVGAYIYKLHLSIDHALAASYRRTNSAKPPKFVARITLVKAVPFYGFHVGYRFYLKIYMLNPLVMTRLADMLHQGLIMNRKFQPYESHLQFLLQFMTDYNLYGCAYIEAKNVAFRAPVPRYDAEEDLPHNWHSQSIATERITDDVELPRVSHCSVEVDICVQDILNRSEVHERPLHHDFVERLNPPPSDVKLVYSMAGLWKDEAKRRKRRMAGKDAKSSPFAPEALVSMTADQRYSQSPGWIHEGEYREQIEEQINQEAGVGGEEPSFETFVQRQPFDESVKTVLQSVEDLYPENLLPQLGLDAQYPDMEQLPNSSIVVDEQGILDFDEGESDSFPYDSGEELVGKAKIAGDKQKESREEKSAEAGESGASSGTLNSPRETKRLRIGSRPDSDGDASLDTVNRLVTGFCSSGLQTGRQPQFPISAGLVTELMRDGLVSKLAQGQGGEQNTIADKASLKRHREVVDDQPTVKRYKSIHGLELDSHAIAAHNKPAVSPQDGAERDPDTIKVATRSPPTTQRKIVHPEADHQKGRGNHTLNFSVVKDPNDPNTRLRLSQLSGASQRHDDSVLKKQHTFDPTATLRGRSRSKTELHEEPPLKPSAPMSSLPDRNSTAEKLSHPRLVWDAPRKMHCLAVSPPTADEIRKSMQDHGLPDVIYQDAYYSDEKDVPPRPREYAGREFRLESNTLPFLPDFDPTGQSWATFGAKPGLGFTERKKADAAMYEQQRARCSLRSWEIAEPPPSLSEVKGWWDRKLQKQRETAQKRQSARAVLGTQRRSNQHQSQVEGPTPKNKHGFKYSQKRKSTSVQHEAQYMSTMSLEVHVNTRGKLVPNPEEDEVKCIFWCVKSDEESSPTSQSDNNNNTLSGVVVLSEDGTLAQRIRSMTSIDVFEETSELDAMVRMVELVRAYDPDVLTGYEVHGSSWGYLIERARFKYEYDLCDEFSRMKSLSHGRIGKDADRWGFNTTSTIRVTGRHMINIWRAMRGELNLLQYTMENVVWHLLHRRIPHYSYKDLTEWYTNGRVADLDKVLRYHLIRTRLDIEILETNELIPRTSEQARLLGVDFFSVFSRGSQFKVESIMFRIAKPENFLLVSPSRKQVGGQNALECLPLVMEPQSAFYTSPLLVLDFQSLYPSVMIAYNYCYSTFLGRIVNWRGTNKMGFTEYKRREGLLKLLGEYINIAPNGMMYTKAEIRKSLLAKMLTEILETRVMVKSGMKQDKDDRTLQQLLNHRQLALKLLANVTYGYTSASFSGRMPCSEIADSIVQTGRETLERAIAYIHSVDRWDAEVVYGDTDSLFVYLKGRTRAQAFKLGDEIAKAITDMNPRPIKLKFEKVYHPCVLLAKKRYVGYKYEHPDQAQPEFDAKGIETVRRDGTPAEQKIEEKALKLLFETADLSEVKAYFQAQCTKIMQGDVSVQDFCFAREVKLGTYSDKGPPPPGALISTKRMLEDARAEPQYGERVPYVVVSGGPGARLIDRCVAPEDLLHDPHSSLDAEYYISKNLIPPLERIFNLVGANVRQWYDEMPKVQRIRRVDATSLAGPAAGAGWKKKTLEAYLKSASCAVCGVKMHKESLGMVCSRCKRDTAGSMVQVQRRLNGDEVRLRDALKVCQTCAGLPPLDSDVRCDSKDCPVFYSRTKLVSRVRTERSIVESVLSELEDPESGRRQLEW